MKFYYSAAKVGGWIKSSGDPDTDVIDLEVEEAEDVSNDQTVVRASPNTPSGALIKSQTKT